MDLLIQPYRNKPMYDAIEIQLEHIIEKSCFTCLQPCSAFSIQNHDDAKLI